MLKNFKNEENIKFPKHFMLGDHVTSEFFDPKKVFPNSTDFKCCMVSETELSLLRMCDRFCNRESIPYVETHIVTPEQDAFIRST